MQRLCIVLAGTVMLLATGQALAESGDVIVEGGVPTATVSYADLNITSAAGRLALDRRVARAATELCIEHRRLPIDELIMENHCFSKALSKARIDIEQAVAAAKLRMASSGTIKLAAR